MNIDIDKVVYNDKAISFFSTLTVLPKIRRDFEKGKGTLSECGYIISVRWKLSESRIWQITRIRDWR